MPRLPSRLSRRDCVTWLSLAAAGSLWPSLNSSTPSCVAAEPVKDKRDKPAAGKRSSSLPPLNRFSRMVQEYFVAQARAIETREDERRTRLATRADAEAYIASVRERIRQAFGPEPERTPLEPRITGVVERDAYRIEKVIFESRPGLLVTANLYVPRTPSPGKRPGVVASCGHSANGKAGETYQAFAQTLAKLGFVTLIFDPLGQGERLQYVDEQWKPRRGIGVAEHLYCGNQQFLVGEFFGAWRAWDGIRALDYLLTRPEVDERQVGITGNSGGGTMTTWLTGLDSRWAMSAPGCFVTTFLRNLENELPADTEQCPPRALALGLDHSDFLAALAPKPVIILAKERDFFDVRGAEEAYERLRRIYELLGAPEQVRLHVGPTEHGYSQENREAMYDWFLRATGGRGEKVEPALQIEKDETLWCTPHGQVAELRSRTVHSFTADLAKQQIAARRPIADNQWSETLRATLRLPAPVNSPPEFRILRPPTGRDYPRKHAATFAIESEPGVFAVVTQLLDQPHYSRPTRGSGPATLYVAHHSSDVELRELDWLRQLAIDPPTQPFFACDVRGIGESRPDTCGADQFLKPYGSDFFYAIHSLMLDRPYVGQKTWDVLRTLDWLAAAGYTRVHLVAHGWGRLPATFASMLSGQVAQVTLSGALESYASQAVNESYEWPLSSFVPDVLRHWDLHDCYAWLREHKQLTLVAPPS